VRERDEKGKTVKGRKNTGNVEILKYR